jgi:hypothetical protein
LATPAGRPWIRFVHRSDGIDTPGVIQYGEEAAHEDVRARRPLARQNDHSTTRPEAATQ